MDEIEEDRVALGLPKEDVLEYLHRHRAEISAQHAAQVAAEDGIPLRPRFKREPHIFLNGSVRFPRLRMFLAKFIGDAAWRGVSL